MTREELLQAVKEAVQAVSPGASVILFGSRARGDAQPDSDWDFLVLTDEALDRQQEKQLLRLLYRIELESEEILNWIQHSRKQWNEPLWRAMPFHEAVRREGIPI